MPDQIDANKAYEKRIAPYQRGGGKIPLTIQKYKDFFSTHRNPADEQLEFDVALWYAFLASPLTDTQWKQVMVKRIFTLLAFGGLLVDKGHTPQTHNWQPWASDQIPICSAISHTARVMVWLPPGNEGLDFWRWLWAGHEPETRGTATHGVAQVPISEIYPGVKKGFKENKSNTTCRHYGVNLVLGGLGNINPISGNVIVDNGHHGHLYLAISKSKMNNRSALLISTEQSAPSDCETDNNGRRLYTNTFSQLNRASQGVPDQYGGKHGLGGHSRFSSTGGDDFGYGNAPSALTDAGYGPCRGHYLDGMYIDLTPERFYYIQAMEFQNQHVSLRGIPPVQGIPRPARPQPQVIARIPTPPPRVQPIQPPPTASPKFFIDDVNLKSFLILNLWLLGDGMADSSLFCLCCHEYKKKPTKKQATFIFHTFVRNHMHTKRGVASLGVHNAALLDAIDSEKNIAEKIFHQFELFIGPIKRSDLKADLIHWWGSISSLDSKASANLFDSALNNVQEKLKTSIPSNWLELVEPAKQMAKDMKMRKGGRTDHAEGEELGYNNKHRKYGGLARVMETAGLDQTAASLTAALRETTF